MVCFRSDRILIILPRHESLIFINFINLKKYFNHAALAQEHMLGSVIERSCLSVEGLNDREKVEQDSWLWHGKAIFKNDKNVSVPVA